MKTLKEIMPYIIITVTVILIRTYIITPIMVSGKSMYNTLDDKNIVILKKYDKTYEYGDIVVFKYNGTKLIKRVIGVPGDYVSYKDGKLYINNTETEDKFSFKTNDFELTSLNIVEIPKGYYFVMGDNRNNSTDSRMIGLIKESDIEGTTTFSIWPLKKFN